MFLYYLPSKLFHRLKCYCIMFFQVSHPLAWTIICIRRRSDYIIGFVTPVIGPNKSKKLTRLLAPTHNIRGKVWMKSTLNMLHRQQVIVCETMHAVLHFNFAAYIVYQRCKPCEFLGFVWTDCWGNKSPYVITSPANWALFCTLSVLLKQTGLPCI